MGQTPASHLGKRSAPSAIIDTDRERKALALVFLRGEGGGATVDARGTLTLRKGDLGSPYSAAYAALSAQGLAPSPSLVMEAVQEWRCDPLGTPA